MPRHQSKINYAPKRDNHAKSSAQAHKSALLSKSGFQSKKVDPQLESAAAKKKSTESLPDNGFDSDAFFELLHGDEAKQLLDELWKDRITPKQRVDSIPPGERVLHIFDVSMKYGPAQGITRLDRWNRAEKLGKKPPTLLKTILEAASHSPQYKEKYELSIFGPLQ